MVGTASVELVFSSPKWLTQPLPLKKFESLKSKRGRETLRRKGKGSGKSLGLIGNARYEGETSPLLPFPPNPSSVCAPLHRCSLPCVMLSPSFSKPFLSRLPFASLPIPSEPCCGLNPSAARFKCCQPWQPTTTQK